MMVNQVKTWVEGDELTGWKVMVDMNDGGDYAVFTSAACFKSYEAAENNRLFVCDPTYKDTENARWVGDSSI